MNRFLTLFLVLLVFACVPASGLVLANKGKTAYTIVTPANPIAPEITAARELQEHLEKMTGARFLILPENKVGAFKNVILVGQTNQTKKILPNTDWKSLGNDGIILRTVGNNIILTGGRPRGVLYSVYTLLEDVLGVRWWSHNETLIPNKPYLAVDNLNIKYIPKILSREAHFYEPNHYGIYAARTKQTGHFHPVPAEYGGHYRILGWCHTFYQLIPPEKYFDKHPEWFSEINGKRVHSGAQLCLANEEMRKELVKNALEWIKEDPSAGIISIAQNDWGGACQCEKCKAVQDAEGAPSGPLVYFVNKVADEINKHYPNFLIETLAYQYTRQAPKHAKPGKNVIIRLCSIECDYGLPLTHPRSKSFVDDLNAWSAISNHLYIWSYIARFGNYVYPNPTLPAYATNIRMFEKNKAIGVFMQGDAYNEAGPFVRLRSWVIAHLLWNPSLSQDKLVKDFVNGYYEDAGPFILQYLQLLEDAYSRRAEGDWMTPKDIMDAQDLFDKAMEAVKKKPVVQERVDRERMPLDYLWITNYEQVKDYARITNRVFNGAADVTTLWNSFVTRAIAYNMNYFSEGGIIAPHLKRWTIRIPTSGPPPAQLGDLSGKKYLDIQENRFRLFGEGNLVNWITDTSASNQTAMSMISTGTNWAVQAAVSEEMRGRKHCYASVKVSTEATQGPAFQVGLYDNNKPEGLMARTVDVSELTPDKYTLIDLGVWDLKEGYYFWFAPFDNPEVIGHIMVDRLFLVNE